MNFYRITLDDAKLIHQKIMELTEEGPQHLRDEGALESALTRPENAEYYEEADILRQASLLCIGISQAQAFVDGNKRTAVAVTDIFLRIRGYKIPRRALIVRRKLEDLAEKLADSPGPEGREQIETEFEEWLRRLVVPENS